MTEVTRLPEPGVVIDLDSEVKPSKDVKPPFIAKVRGRNITFLDPSDIDWRDLAAVRIPADLIRVSLSTEDRHFLQDQDLKAWEFNRLMEAYSTHYDLEAKLRNAQRQSQFNA